MTDRAKAAKFWLGTYVMASGRSEDGVVYPPFLAVVAIVDGETVTVRGVSDRHEFAVYRDPELGVVTDVVETHTPAGVRFPMSEAKKWRVPQ